MVTEISPIFIAPKKWAVEAREKKKITVGAPQEIACEQEAQRYEILAGKLEALQKEIDSLRGMLNLLGKAKNMEDVTAISQDMDQWPFVESPVPPAPTAIYKEPVHVPFVPAVVPPLTPVFPLPEKIIKLK